MSIESRISRLNQLISSRQIDPQLEVKIAAFRQEFASMTDEELRAIASGQSSEEFTGMTDCQLWEIVARES